MFRQSLASETGDHTVGPFESQAGSIRQSAGEKNQQRRVKRLSSAGVGPSMCSVVNAVLQVGYRRASRDMLSFSSLVQNRARIGASPCTTPRGRNQRSGYRCRNRYP